MNNNAVNSYKLSFFRLCPLSRQIRVLMNVLQIPYSSKERDIFVISSIERLSPTMVTPKNHVFTGFWSIYQYLNDNFDNYLLPSQEERLNFLSDLELINSKFYYEVVYFILIKSFNFNQAVDYSTLRYVEAKLQSYLVFFNHVLEKNDGFFYAQKSFLDIALACHISTLDYLNQIKFKEYSFIHKWYMVIKSDPAFRDLLKDRVAPITPPFQYDKIDF